MPSDTSAARPVSLFIYADWAQGNDSELLALSQRLTGALQRFETSCSEPGFCVSASYLSRSLESYARETEPIDRGVQRVAEEFQKTDSWLSLSWLVDILSPSDAFAAEAPDVMVSEVTEITIRDWIQKLDETLNKLGSFTTSTLRQLQKKLENETQALKDRISKLETEIASLQQRIKRRDELMAHRRELEAQLGDFWTKIKPVFPLALGGDDLDLSRLKLDAPWRTQADALEDEIAQIGKELAALGLGENCQADLQALESEMAIRRLELAKITQAIPLVIREIRLRPYEVPVQKQTKGSYECAPTCLSMLLAYYHERDARHPKLTPQEIIAKLGDAYSPTGIAADELAAEINQMKLGLQAECKTACNADDIRVALQDGPIMANVHLGVDPSSKTDAHMIVVTGLSADGKTVYVNDPWTGHAEEWSWEKFENKWTFSSYPGELRAIVTIKTKS